MSAKPPRKALVLLSGGLDSQLAACVLRAQGVQVEALAFSSPFFGVHKAAKAAAALGLALHVSDFTEEILALVQDPPHGLGGAMNPCIDCHARMVLRAGERMERLGFDFIATGEVLAQRPMSQNRQSLAEVAKCSTYGDLLVRPLCARLLPPTRPVREGWIDAGRLPAFSGRGRAPQIRLAAHFGITDYPTPAGGCLLTEMRYGWKLRDLLDHEGPDAARANVRLLRVGRHFRLSDDVKLIVGSCAAENRFLEQHAPGGYLHIACAGVAGPVALAPPHIGEELLRTAAAICARYAKTPAGRPAAVRVAGGSGAPRTVAVEPMDPEEVRQYMIAIRPPHQCAETSERKSSNPSRSRPPSS